MCVRAGAHEPQSSVLYCRAGGVNKCPSSPRRSSTAAVGSSRSSSALALGAQFLAGGALPMPAPEEHPKRKEMMDPENIGKDAVIRVSNWLRGIWEMRRRTSPVQQWVDSLPSPAKSTTSSIGSIVRQQSISVDSESASIPECTVEHVLSEKENFIGHSNMTVSTPIAVPHSPAISYPGVSRLARDPSFQSDSSHCSSVESLLELRRADPEAVLLSLGFGGCASSPQDGGPLSRIPKRFLQPSRLKGIAINEFMRHQQEASESLDSTSLGYRGLTGSPYVAPSEIVQKIMQRLREHETHELDAYPVGGCYSEPWSPAYQQEGRLSVLSPDNRQYLERPRSKSPDMRNKRMIIGQRSFAFGRDGDLIEIKPQSAAGSSQESDDVFDYVDTTKDIPQSEYRPAHTASETRKPRLTDLKSDASGGNRDSTETMTPSKVSSIPEPSTAESPRRSSDSTCDRSSKSSLQDAEDGRRFSDGVVQSMKKATRKKSLQRQPKIRDSLDNVEESVSSVRCAHCGKLGRDKHDEEEEDEEEVSCCYKRTSQNCWREMEKVLQKNQKLEEVVAKSRREVAEIRGILSSVLSVRMEPGF